MAGRVEGKVAFITGAARGQGRSHAVRLAQEGADIVAVDICGQIDSVPYAMSTPDDLAETARQVEALDRRIVATQADVRDADALRAALDDGVAQLGRLDIVAANAGIFPFGDETHEVAEGTWRDVMDVNLTGVWHACKVAVPHLRAGGRGGSIVITSSAAGLMGGPKTAPYTSSKHALVGLMRTLTLELAPDSIRVNSVHPTGVNTPMVVNEAAQRFIQDDPSMAGMMQNPLPVEMVEPVDISNAVLFLASDEARYITGVTFPVDAGLVTG